MQVATLNRIDHHFVFTKVMIAAFLALTAGACSGEGPRGPTEADVALAQKRHLDGCLIRAELRRRAANPDRESKTPQLMARFVRGPAPFLREQSNLTHRIEILDAAGATVWSMGYDPKGPGLFRLPCVPNAHVVRINSRTSGKQDASLVAVIEDSQL